jgi:hypothetical protein
MQLCHEMCYYSMSHLNATEKASRIHVYRNGAQAVPFGVWTITQFNTIIFDNLDEFRQIGANYYFQPKQAGYYLIHVTLSFSPLQAANTQSGIELTNLAGIARKVSWSDKATFGNYLMSHLTTLEYLTPNDTIEIRMNTSDPASSNIQGAITNCYLIIQRVG